MGTKLLLGFGSTVNQAVVHPKGAYMNDVNGFGGTVNQAVVHRAPPTLRGVIVSEVR